MKKTILLLSILFSIVANSQTFTLKSKDLGGQVTKKQIANTFGCKGDNNSPDLFWENAPKGTKSFAIIMHDKDAPTQGGGWYHWVVFDIPKNITEIKSGAGDITKNLMPKDAIQGITNFGFFGYGGPCPPQGHGFHEYKITVYALKTDKLGIDKNTNPATVGFYLWNNTIEKASLAFYYKRD